VRAEVGDQPGQVDLLHRPFPQVVLEDEGHGGADITDQLLALAMNRFAEPPGP
jgi:hypothetical protein